MGGVVLVMVACGSAEEAVRLATCLVTERLAACVQALPMTSTYRWQGRVERGEETLLLIKTRGEAWPALEARVRALHGYEVPEILCVPAAGVSPAYAAWVEGSVDVPEETAGG